MLYQFTFCKILVLYLTNLRLVFPLAVLSFHSLLIALYFLLVVTHYIPLSIFINLLTQFTIKTLVINQKHNCQISISWIGAWPTPKRYTLASKESTGTPWAGWYEFPKFDSAFFDDKFKSAPKMGPHAFFLNAIAFALFFS